MFIAQFNSENPHKRHKCVVCGDFTFNYYMIYKENKYYPNISYHTGLVKSMYKITKFKENYNRD